MFTKCSGCGIEMHHGDFCWLCELGMSNTKEVYVNNKDNILIWCSFKNELCPIKLTTEKFIMLVKKQYSEE